MSSFKLTRGQRESRSSSRQRHSETLSNQSSVRTMSRTRKLAECWLLRRLGSLDLQHTKPSETPQSFCCKCFQWETYEFSIHVSFEGRYHKSVLLINVNVNCPFVNPSFKVVENLHHFPQIFSGYIARAFHPHPQNGLGTNYDLDFC